MVFLLILFVLAVSAALWFMWRVLLWVPWPVSLWCFLTITLVAAVKSGEIIVSPAERVVMTLWSGAVVFIPLVYFVLAVVRPRKS